MIESLLWQRPWLLLLGALLPLYVVMRLRRMGRDAVLFAPLELRPEKGGSRRSLFAALACEVLVLLCTLAALAGPYRERRLELYDDEGIDVALVLDVSLSMNATDFPPSRLAALSEIARSFLDRGGGDRVGLVIFAADTVVQSPLTTDRVVLNQLLDSVTVYTLNPSESGGTAIGDALLVAAHQLERVKAEGRDQAIVLITDGESNAGIDPVLAARYVAEKGVALHAIGIGGEEPIPVTFEGRPVGGDNPYVAVLDSAQLEAVARASGGNFHRATDVGALGRIFGDLSRLESAPLSTRELAVRTPWVGPLALATALLFALHWVLTGVVLRRPYR